MSNLVKLNNYKGLLFVGDPHLWSKKPNKRLDNDFTAVVLDKISQAVKIAMEENLYLVFLGDLFHVDDESNIEMLTKLTRILKPLKKQNPAATVEGNHEKKQVVVSDDVALALLKEGDSLFVMEKNDWWGEMDIDGANVLIGSTPYGLELPTSVKLPKHLKDKDVFTFWLSHHNLAFDNTYPGAQPVEEIEGIDVLVNGHIHQTKKPMKRGKMLAHNPGNITRLSTDCADHIPAVWKWVPSQGQELEPIPLVFKKEVFNMVKGSIEVVLEPQEIKEAEITPHEKLKFVEGLEEQMKTITEEELNHDENKTDDGGEIKMHINAMSKALNSSNELKETLLELVNEVLKEEEGK